MRYAFHLLSAVAVAALAAGPALAEDTLLTPYKDTPPRQDVSTIFGEKPKWVLTINAVAYVSPDYIGASTYSPWGFPTVTLARAGSPEAFGAPDDAVSLAFYDTGAFRTGFVGRAMAGRYDGSDAKLSGLDDVKWAVEPGLFAEYWPIEWLRTRAEVRYGMNGYWGWVGTLGMDAVAKHGAFTFSFGPRLNAGDQRFMDAWFGVSEREAIANGRVWAYDPDGGISSWGLVGGVDYAWNDRWHTTLYGTYNNLVGDAGRSPIVKEIGSADQFAMGLKIGYSFGVGKDTPVVGNW